jgi:alkanesulfonate monooxygenase SsuD/methylene tetrahydromethanopterin reductase-like flavin-dependent oxidoreductase (luciferase family)
MRFGIFYEHQLPRPWAEGDERRLLTDALEQVELADRLGIDYLWEVEHHLAPPYGPTTPGWAGKLHQPCQSPTVPAVS